MSSSLQIYVRFLLCTSISIVYLENNPTIFSIAISYLNNIILLLSGVIDSWNQKTFMKHKEFTIRKPKVEQNLESLYDILWRASGNINISGLIKTMKYEKDIKANEKPTTMVLNLVIIFHLNIHVISQLTSTKTVDICSGFFCVFGIHHTRTFNIKLMFIFIILSVFIYFLLYRRAMLPAAMYFMTHLRDIFIHFRVIFYYTIVITYHCELVRCCSKIYIQITTWYKKFLFYMWQKDNYQGDHLS